jgi:CheY-like chemotaxis protein
MLYKKRLLLIDSSDSTRTILFKQLNEVVPDIDVIACGTAKEAITACKRFDFEIITTGLSLPDMDGYDMIEQIRKLPRSRETPVFVVSGDTDTHVVSFDDEDITAITAYFNKSEGPKTLVHFIADFLSREETLNARILYVDPSATSSAVTNSILRKNNFDFLHLTDGESTLNELRLDLQNTGSCSYDVLITDFSLDSRMTGFQLIQAVRKELKLDYLTLPILLMTVVPEENEKTDFTGIFGAGTNDFITKPIDEDSLLERIINLINIKRQSEAVRR